MKKERPKPIRKRPAKKSNAQEIGCRFFTRTYHHRKDGRFRVHVSVDDCRTWHPVTAECEPEKMFTYGMEAEANQEAGKLARGLLIKYWDMLPDEVKFGPSRAAWAMMEELARADAG